MEEIEERVGVERFRVEREMRRDREIERKFERENEGDR